MADQIRQICATLKLSGYRSKSKEETLRIMAISKLHAQSYDAMAAKNQQRPQQKPKIAFSV
jgi:hypothetical protein